MRISQLTAVIVCTAMLSACASGGEKGNPTPAPPSNSSSGNGSADKLPQRPKSLKLDAVDTCKLLSADQMKQLETVVTRPVDLDLVDGKKSPGCHYSPGGRYTYTVGAVTHKGVSYWLEGSGTVSGKVIKVADYSAVEIEFVGGSGVDCSVAIDVADGQQLMVSYIPTTTGEKDQTVLCGKAEKAAGFALATLKTLK